MGKVSNRGRLTVVKKTKDATICRTIRGSKIVLMTPTGKCKRYKRELKNKRNSRTGQPLNDCAAGYRMGYRAALGEQAKIWKRKNKK